MRRSLTLPLLLLILAVPALVGATWDNGSPVTRLVSRYFHADPVVVISVGQDTHNMLDVLVTFELARLSSTPPLQIHKQRLSGAHWSAVMAQHGIQPQALTTGLSPLPNSLDRLAHQKGLYDDDVRELVGLRFVSEALGQPVASVSASRNAGVSYESMIAGGQQQ